MEFISVFDIFKIGVGPSSSHTMGPWKAAGYFIKKLDVPNLESIQVRLYGSLAKTGRGHGTDIAVLLGLSGFDPKTYPVEELESYVRKIHRDKQLCINNRKTIEFDPLSNIHFVYEKLPFHPNAMTFVAEYVDGNSIQENYYSIGGGFVVQENENPAEVNSSVQAPYPIASESDLLNCIRDVGCTIPEIVLKNELALSSHDQVTDDLLEIWQTMLDCIYKGCHTSGTLPGGLEVKRRAAEMNENLLPNARYSNTSEWMEEIRRTGDSFSNVNKWVSCFALAVNEENASFGRVVTAPTNGAAGVIPAVLMYLLCFCKETDEQDILTFLLTAGEIGSLFKKGSTISAAMGGCQAEIGVSSAMAAAGLTQCLGGNARQVLMAAEISMEHHLGLTCDPVNGLVQVPCIERNTMGAIKAITASQIALSSNPDHAKVSLNSVIKTMWETAQDMNDKYKETSDGGLAINVSVGLPEC